MGFTEPIPSRESLVVSYTTVSPLPYLPVKTWRAKILINSKHGGLLSVALSIGFTLNPCGTSSLTAQPLAGIPPCGARTFLTPSSGARPCPFPGRIVASWFCRHKQSLKNGCSREMGFTGFWAKNSEKWKVKSVKGLELFLFTFHFELFTSLALSQLEAAHLENKSPRRVLHLEPMNHKA